MRGETLKLLLMF